MSVTLHTDRNIHWSEFAALMESAGWGAGYSEEQFLTSCGAYPLVVHARATDGALVGYATAFSDGVFSTWIGELVVHPSARRSGLGASLLRAVEARYPGVPVYADVLQESRSFFEACGYRPMPGAVSMFKRT